MRTALRLAGQHPAPHTSLLLLFRLDHARTARPALIRHPSLAGSAPGAAGRVSRAPPLPHPAGTLAPPGPPPWQRRPAPARSSSAARASFASVRRSEPGPSNGERPGVALRRSAPAVSSASAASRAGWSGPAEYYTRRLHPVSEPPSSCRGPGAHGRWRRRRRGCGGCFCCLCSAKVSPAGGQGQVGVAEWTQSKTPFCLPRAAGSAFAGRRGGAGNEVVRRAGRLRPQAGRVSGWRGTRAGPGGRGRCSPCEPQPRVAVWSRLDRSGQILSPFRRR